MLPKTTATRFLLVPAVGILSVATLLAADKVAAKADKTTAKAGAEASAAKVGADGKPIEEEEETGGLQATKFMPLGRPNLEVKIPQFEDGELQCVMNAMEMTRVDDEDIDIKSMEIEFLEDGEAVTRIELLDARYNLSDRLISTENRSVVQRADFTLVGESLEFDTVEQRGKMKGKVRMVIHDTSSFAGKKEEEKAESEAEPLGRDGGLSVLEAARMIARVAAHQQRQAINQQ